MKEQFREYKFRKSTLAQIAQAEQIISEYSARGMSLTLRQIYYQFVSRDLIKNDQKEYKALGDLLNKARLAGLIDWSAMEDRTRGLKGYDAASGVTAEAALIDLAESYAQSRWDDQPYAPEVWIEKDALTGVIQPICSELRLSFFSCRGYVSQSEQYKAGKRFRWAHRNGKTPIVFHLGDHDPSGMHMTVDNRDRFAMFAAEDVEVVRLALNTDQVQLYNPPPNPAKMTDSRAAEYVAYHGDQSWELDALSPEVIEDLIRQAVEPLINWTFWREAEAQEEATKDQLARISDRYGDIVEWLNDTGQG